MTSSKEVNIRECKICKESKKHIYVKKFNNGKDKKYVDDEGKQWNGKTCPGCHLHLVKIGKRNKITPNDQP